MLSRNDETAVSPPSDLTAKSNERVLSYRLQHLMAPEQSPELLGGVLRPPVGVKDQPGCGMAQSNRHLQGITDEAGAHVVGQ
jgi:hypothetical protein